MGTFEGFWGFTGQFRIRWGEGWRFCSGFRIKNWALGVLWRTSEPIARILVLDHVT